MNPDPWTKKCPECGNEGEDLLRYVDYNCPICGYTKPKESPKKVVHTNNVPEIPFQEQLKNELQSIKIWETLRGRDLDDAETKFVLNITRLYLDYFQYHHEEATTIAKKFVDDLLFAAGVLREDYVLLLLGLFESTEAWDGGWDNVCLVATEIKAFDDLFGNIAAKIEATEFWDYLESYRYEWVHSKNAPPENVPNDHWWWFTKYDIEGKGELLNKRD